VRRRDRTPVSEVTALVRAGKPACERERQRSKGVTGSAISRKRETERERVSEVRERGETASAP
jgi:hypothetical protein